MKAEDLRKSILQLAIQGKLVKQNPDDEPASVLIERIRAEKQRLAKEGKIKKDKTDSFIYRSADNSYYEKIGNTTRCIDEEIPFDVPERWEWCRFKSVVNFNLGKTPERNESRYWNNGKYPWVSIADMQDKSILTTTKEQVSQIAYKEKFNEQVVPSGTLLMSFKLTIGKVSILGIDAFHNEAIISIYPYINNSQVFKDYLFHILALITEFTSSTDAIKGATLNSAKINEMLIPVPSLAEQALIIQKINELENYLSKYDKLEQQETKLNDSVLDALKKSILQSAIQGKLVAQNPGDKPASVLLEKIRKEKEQLIKAGKLRRDKNESFIYKDAADNSYYESRNGKVLCIDDEIPFEIPDNWVWCRLGNIAQHNTGKTLDKERNKGILRRYITTSNLYWGYFDLTETRQMPFKEEELERCTAQKGDLLICEGGEAGRSAIWQSENPICFQNHIHRMRPYANISSEYLLRFMEKINLSGEINIYRKGVGIKGLSGNALASVLIPLPPLNEQKRIIKKIEQLFAPLS
jgi:type I restriction enzyme S subunit